MIDWQEGRQGTGYLKKLLWFGPTPFSTVWFDIHLLKFPVGSGIPWHVDRVNPGEKHYRLNVYLKGARRGGEFLSKKKPIVNGGFFQLFRPDINAHMVTKVEEGTRYVLSIGWVTEQYGPLA